MSAPTISVIIPVLNDTAALKLCLAALNSSRPDLAVEIIVADGGDSADCKAAVLAAGAQYISAPRGRALQMNAAAELARGEWLWFLHADCIPHPDSLRKLASLDEKSSWGCFKHRVDAPGFSLRIIECADNLRARFFRLPYGDQGIFVRRNIFEKLGRYEEVPLLEDVILVRKLAKTSAPRVLAPLLRTDARRWLSRGVIATTVTNWKVMWLYLVCRKSPQELAAIYRGQEAEPLIANASK